MKTIIALTLLALSPWIYAHGAGQTVAGPNGGKIIKSVEPHFEFFVTAERKIQLTFLTEDNKPTAAAQQQITAIGGDRAAPTQFTFVKQGDILISEQALPAGKEIPMILQVKTTPEAKMVTSKFNINLAQCSSCEHLEYACTCAH